MLYDDDDAEMSPSSAETYDSPAEAKRRALKERLEKKGFKSQAEKQGTNLKDLKLSVLKHEMEGKKDEERKREESAKQNVSTDTGTKTREQEILSSKLTALDKPDTDRMVQSAKQAEKSEDDLRQEKELQGEDA